jgi:TolB-like protein
MKFFDELKRRNVIKETLAYLVVSWVLLQVISVVLPIFDAPGWVLKTVTFLLALGLPFWVIFSWTYQVTPEGFKKTSKISEEQSVIVATNKRLNIIIIVTLIIAIGVTFIQKPASNAAIKEIVSNDLTSYNSIAVLPFTDYSPGKDEPWLSEGMTKNMIQELRKISSLTVPSTTTMRTYKETNKTLPEIARELNVGALLEGSTERRNDSVRITATLMNTNEKQLWAQDFDVAMEEFNVLGYNISQRIVKELKLVLTPADSARFKTPSLVDPEALEADLKGLKIAFEAGNIEKSKLAVEYFKQAIELDSTYAPAYAHLAWIYNTSYPYFCEKSPLDAFEMSEAVNTIALRLDPQLTLAYLNQFRNLYYAEWKWEEGLRILSKAQSLSLNDPEVLDGFLYYYLTSGKFDKAFKTLEKIHQIRGNDWLYFAEKVFVQFHSRDLEGVLQTAEESLKLFPGNTANLSLKMWALSLLGKHEEAVSAARQFMADENSLSPINRGEIGCVFARAGLKKEALEQLEILKSSKLNYIDPVSIGLLYMGLGDKDLAMDYFEQGYKTRSPWMVFLKRGPPFDAMRGDPRFEKLIQELKFP